MGGPARERGLGPALTRVVLMASPPTRNDMADDLFKGVIFLVLPSAAEDDRLVDRHHALWMEKGG